MCHPKGLENKNTTHTLHYNFVCIPLLATLKMAAWVAETCRRLLCNKIAFTHPRVIVALFKKISTFFIHTFAFSSGCQNALKFIRLAFYVKNALTFLCVCLYA